MHMRMADEGLPPGVQDAPETDRRPEVTGISGDLEQRGGTRAKEEVIQERGVAAGQWMKHVRQREDHVDVRHVEELTLTRASHRSRACA